MRALFGKVSATNDGIFFNCVKMAEVGSKEFRVFSADIVISYFFSIFFLYFLGVSKNWGKTTKMDGF